MSVPAKSQTLSKSEATKLLRQIGAVRKEAYEDPGTYLYWSASTNWWILVTPLGQVYRLDYHRGCPC